MLGGAFAEAFLRVGAKVALLDLDGAHATERASELAAAHGGQCEGFACDVLTETPSSALKPTSRKDSAESRYS